MSADDSQIETAPPGDVRELWMARRRKEVFQNVRGFAYLFVGLQACPLILYSLEVALPIPTLLFSILALGAFLAVLVSAVVALIGAAIALRNAWLLEWWMIGTGALPWMVIATEATVIALFAWM